MTTTTGPFTSYTSTTHKATYILCGHEYVRLEHIESFWTEGPGVEVRTVSGRSYFFDGSLKDFTTPLRGESS